MRTVALLLLTTFAPQTFAAPAPFRPREARPAPAPCVQPGRWAMDWCGSAWDVELWGDGTYRGRSGEYGDTWRGTWTFDPQTRVLTVHEASASGCTLRWDATLGATLSGRVGGGGGGSVRFTRR
jgi:hypothetical protein